MLLDKGIIPPASAPGGRCVNVLIARRLGLDLASNDSRVKMAVLTEYLEDQLGFGTVDEPDEYFQGTLSMKIGSIDVDEKSNAYTTSALGPRTG